MKKPLILLLLSCLCVSPRALADVEVEVRYWGTNLDSSVGLDARDFEPDLDADVGLDLDLGFEAEDDFEGRITLRPGLGFFLRAAYQNLAADGDGEAVIDFGGIPVPVPADVVSRLDFEYGRFAVGWQYVSPDRRLRIGPFAEAKGVRGDAAVEASALGTSASLEEEFEAAAVAAGALLEVRPTARLQIFAEASTVVDQDEVDLTDAEAGLRFFVTDHVSLGGGYRRLEIEGEIDGIALALEYDGVFASAVFRF